jgi:hypothetical protein
MTGRSTSCDESLIKGVILTLCQAPDYIRNFRCFDEVKCSAGSCFNRWDTNEPHKFGCMHCWLTLFDAH